MVQLNEDNLVALEHENRGSNIYSKILWFHHKNITEIQPHTFDKYQSLKELSLFYNNLTELPRGLFRHLSNMDVIDLRYNQFKTIDSDIFQFNQNLKSISLISHYTLESLPSGVFDNLPELEYLFLNGNKLTTFDFNSLKDSPKLKRLQLHYNNLVEIVNFDLHKTLWKTLVKINLKHNQICSVQTLRERSDPNIVELDDDNDKTRKLCAANEQQKNLDEETKAIAKRNISQDEK